MRKALALSATWLLLSSVGVSGQIIRGRLLETSEGVVDRPLSGAFVSLVASDGTQTAQAFSDADGGFVLTPTVHGTYRVWVQRIGIEDWTSDPLEVDASDLSVTFRVPVRPVRLPDLDVQLVLHCVTDPDDAPEVSLVWEEARKALQTTVWLEDEQNAYRFAIRRYVRFQDPESLGTRGGEAHSDTVGPPPFVSLPASRLAQAGYVVSRSDGIYFYAPDAEVLLSEEFRRDQCFGLERATRDGAELIGLRFAPEPNVRTASIEGTLWIDALDSELRALEYTYANVDLPQGTDRRRAGGEVRFSRLPNGPFFVTHWWLRMPLRFGTQASQRREAEHGGLAAGVGRLAGYRLEGGEVFDVFDGDRLVYTVAGATIEGSALDNVQGLPLSGARVLLESTLFDVIADDQGRFRFGGVPAGHYRVSVRHGTLDALGLTLGGEVQLAGSERIRLVLETAGMESTFSGLCPGIEPTHNLGAMVGVVRRLESGAPVEGARVTARWDEFHVRAPLHGDPVLERVPRYRSVATDGAGVYRICGVPGGHDISLVVGPETGEPSSTIRLDGRIRVVHHLKTEPVRRS